MFDFSVFPMVFGKGTQNSTSKFHNFANWIPILEVDNSMSLWSNSLMVYIKIFVLKEGRNFTLLSCSIFPYFQWFPEYEADFEV